MMSEHEITGTMNIMLLHAFNAINGNHQSDNKSINHISGIHSAGNTRLWRHGGGLIVDAITMVLIPRLEYGLAACHAEFEVIIII